MAKRFTDTNKYKKPFVRGLKGPYKLFWDFLYHDCDHAGIWIVDFDIAQLYLGTDMPVNRADALKYFNADETRIVELDKGCRWFIVPFVDFQYGTLSENNRAHNGVISTLKKYELLDESLNVKISAKPLTSPLQGGMDKDKEKDKDKEQEKEGEKIKKEKTLLTETEKSFERFESWLSENAPSVLKMKEPITIKQYEKITKDFAGKKEELESTFTAMHNNKDLLKKYTSANLTFREWIKRRIDSPIQSNYRQNGYNPAPTSTQPKIILPS